MSCFGGTPVALKEEYLKNTPFFLLAAETDEPLPAVGCLSSSPALGGAALFLEYDPPSGSPPPPPEEIVEDDRDLAATPPRLAKREQAYWSALEAECAADD